MTHQQLETVIGIGLILLLLAVAFVIWRIVVRRHHARRVREWNAMVPPVFCRECGKKLVWMPIIHRVRFDARTGEELQPTHEKLKCPDHGGVDRGVDPNAHSYSYDVVEWTRRRGC